MELLGWIHQVASSVKPDVIVNLGDTFHNHAVLRSELLSEFKDHVEQCLKHVNKYYYVLGNHDMFKPNDARYHALQSFDIENFIVVDEVMNVGDITFVPYQYDLDSFPTTTNPICIAHQTFIGADYGFHRPDAGVDADKVSAELIISGHVHMRQQFGKVHYPGTPVHDSMSDADQVKGLDLFDTDTYEFKFIESPFPKYKTLTYNLASDFSVLNMHDDVCSSVNEHDHWILKVTGPKPEIIEYTKSDNWLSLQKKYKIRLRPEFTTSNKVDRASLSTSSIYDSVDEYIDKVYDGALSKDMLKSKAHKVINTAIKSSV